MTERISNGMLRAMTAEARASAIAELSTDARRALAHIAVLGANRYLGAAQASDATPSRIAYVHHEARALLNLAIELTRPEES